jgi:3',5'-cyclic AMP phosphodiesterase CpdA
MSLLLHVSDTHFGTAQPQVLEALSRLIARTRPDIVVHSGDVTQRAAGREFRQAKELMERHAEARWLVVPGNHDVPLWNPFRRLLCPYSSFTKGLGLPTESEIDLPDVLLLGVNTTRPWRHKHGEVSKAQIERAAERLRQASPAQLRIIVTHQPIYVITQRDRLNRLRGAERAIAEWSRAGADLFLGGHIHLPYVRQIQQPERGLTRRVWVVQAGTAVSSRTRGRYPNSVYLVRCGGGRPCVVERWDFSTAESTFSETERFELELARLVGE